MATAEEEQEEEVAPKRGGYGTGRAAVGSFMMSKCVAGLAVAWNMAEPWQKLGKI